METIKKSLTKKQLEVLKLGREIREMNRKPKQEPSIEVRTKTSLKDLRKKVKALRKMSVNN